MRRKTAFCRQLSLVTKHRVTILNPITSIRASSRNVRFHHLQRNKRGRAHISSGKVMMTFFLPQGPTAYRVPGMATTINVQGYQATLQNLRRPTSLSAQQSGVSAKRPLLGLPLTQNHRRLHRQWCDERRIWVAELNEVVFTDESRICLQHHDGRIRVWRHRGERMLNICVMHRHTAPAPGIMVWSNIGYHSRTHLVRIPGTLNSYRYISKVLEPVVLSYLQGLATFIFQQDNARPHVARIVQRFFVNQQIELLPWPARSSDLPPIENMWSMVAQRWTQITPQLPHQINFGNVWKLVGLLYPKNTSKVSLNQFRGVWQW
ncbi:transposable element Tcb1 transposase [Trichonephila clavipes]|nr:transposable element Tcb1 transposase [Trichonephila clavipes]